VIGFTDAHTRAHLYRAIIEGKERVEARGKLRITSPRVSGGGSQSDAAMQVTVDVLKPPAAPPQTYETSALGALGLHRDFETAVAAMTRLGASFEPNAENAALYDALYSGVYRRMYERLAPPYAQLGGDPAADRVATGRDSSAECDLGMAAPHQAGKRENVPNARHSNRYARLLEPLSVRGAG
jgi:hypothetical protein